MPFPPLYLYDPETQEPNFSNIATYAALTGVYEKHLTLAMAKQLRALLQSTGKYRVLLTREKCFTSNLIKFNFHIL